MKILKFIINFVWTFSLQNLFGYLGMLWKWLWSLTATDEKAAAIAKEIISRAEKAADELGDVVDALAGKEINANGKSEKSKSKSKK